MNLPDKITGNTYTAAEFTEFKNEIINLLTSAGLTPANNSIQNKQAVARYASGGDFYIDSGAANAYVLGTIGSQDRPDTLINGASAVFEAGNTNTGASTASVNGTGAKSIKKNGYADNLGSGDIVAGRLYSLRYSSGDDAYELGSVGYQDFRSSKTTDGYTYLPNGLIMQWGSYDLWDHPGGAIRNTITFPKPFPNAILQVAPSVQEISNSGAPGSTITLAWRKNGASLSDFILVSSEYSSAVQDVEIGYIAIGY